MDELQNYMKGLNPQADQQQILIYGSQYKLWREGKYLGIATWTQDENVGDSFQIRTLTEEGVQCDIFVADKWELVISLQ